MILTFDPEKHEYALDGSPIPSVSKVIEPLYDFRFVSPENLERARQRGHAIHKTIELFEQNRLNFETLHPDLWKCLEQWMDFKEVTSFVPRRQEQMVYSEKYGYAGTFDTDGTMAGDEMLLDIKGGQKYEPHKIQTAAYKLAGVERGILTENCRRASLYITPDNWTLEFHRDEGERVVFLSLLTVLKWRMHNARNSR